VVGVLLVIALVFSVRALLHRRTLPAVTAAPEATTLAVDGGIEVPTYLGGPARRTYGRGPAPKSLHVLWKLHVGQGFTNRKSDNKAVLWSGTGWTGQPTLVRQGGREWLLIGGYDHKLRRVDAATGKTKWTYAFDDVIKGTNTVFAVKQSGKTRVIVVAGSRRGVGLHRGARAIAPFRAIDFATGRELWRLPVPKTANYSQDVDASALYVDGVLYVAVEPGYVYAIDPLRTQRFGTHRRPVVLARSPRLFTSHDAAAHPDIGGANVAIEGSPTLLGKTLYVSSGAGHVWGLSVPDLKVVWDYRTGSDIDSTPATTRGGRLLVGIEKEYIPGHGGAAMLDPRKPAAHALVWYFPTPDRGIGEWSGGVVGSVAVNDEYDRERTRPALAAFAGVDGPLYVVSQDQLAEETGRGPRNQSGVPTPKLVYRSPLGGSISTPVFTADDAIIAAGYDRTLHLYRLTYGPAGRGDGVDLRCRDGVTRRVRVRQTSRFTAGGSFESTPLVWNGRVYVGCRDGWLYCLGDR